jgi:hypothetical protein
VPICIRSSSRKHDNYPGVARQFCVPTACKFESLKRTETSTGLRTDQGRRIPSTHCLKWHKPSASSTSCRQPPLVLRVPSPCGGAILCQAGDCTLAARTRKDLLHGFAPPLFCSRGNSEGWIDCGSRGWVVGGIMRGGDRACVSFLLRG